MQSFAQFIHRISNWESLIICIAFFLGFQILFLKNAAHKIEALAGRPAEIIDITFGFNPQKTLHSVAGYGDAGRSYYAQVEMTTDVVYPLVYAFLFSIILSLLYRHRANSRIHLLPFVTVLFDYLENINIVILLLSYPSQSMTVAILCEVFKLLKWISFGLVLVFVFYGLVRKLVTRKPGSTPSNV